MSVSPKSLIMKKLFLFQSLLKPPPHKFRPSGYTAAAFSTSKTNLTSRAKAKVKSGAVASQVKRRTRSDRELDEESFLKCHGNDNCSHIPVMLGEVLDVFASVPLRSFVDCTLGAAGHSSAVDSDFCFRSSSSSLLSKSLLKPPPHKFRPSGYTAAAFSTSKTNLTSRAKAKVKSGAVASQVKRRTRSDRELDEESFLKCHGNDNCSHIPVMLGEVLDVFASVPLRSFVDCTLGAAGHSSAIIRAHNEMKLFVGIDVDPVAHEIADARIRRILARNTSDAISDLQVVCFVQNYKNIKFVLGGIDEKLSAPGISGILMDLGMSSMQVNNAERGFSVLSNGPLDMRMSPLVSLKAEDILNAWPDAEVGKVLREYGEESNWHHLQKRIVNARCNGGLHSTAELVDLIRSSTSQKRGGRQGWIKTATRVFQALRIAVNDELNTLQDSIYACFDSLASGGRLAVITFHSLEDRIVKQAFINIVKCNGDIENGEDRTLCDPSEILVGTHEKEAWIRQMIRGQKATILTKRPITPSEKEEKLNPRSRSAKLRVIEKV